MLPRAMTLVCCDEDPQPELEAIIRMSLQKDRSFNRAQICVEAEEQWIPCQKGVCHLSVGRGEEILPISIWLEDGATVADLYEKVRRIVG